MSRQPFTPCPLCGTPQNWHRFSFGFLLKQAQAFLINYKTPTTKHPPPVSQFFREAKKYVLPRSSDVSEVQRLLGSGQAVVLAWGDARNLEMEPWSQWENMEGVLGVGDVQLSEGYWTYTLQSVTSMSSLFENRGGSVSEICPGGGSMWSGAASEGVDLRCKKTGSICQPQGRIQPRGAPLEPGLTSPGFKCIGLSDCNVHLSHLSCGDWASRGYDI